MSHVTCQINFTQIINYCCPGSFSPTPFFKHHFFLIIKVEKPFYQAFGPKKPFYQAFLGPLTNPNPAACCPRRPLSGTYVTLAVSEKKHRLNRMSVRRTVHVRARRQHDAGRGAPAVPPCVNPPRVRAANTAATTLRAPGVSWGACTCMPDAKGPCTATVHVLYSVGVVRVLSWCSHALPPLPPPSSLSTCLLLPAP